MDDNEVIFLLLGQSNMVGRGEFHAGTNYTLPGNVYACRTSLSDKECNACEFPHPPVDTYEWKKITEEPIFDKRLDGRAGVSLTPSFIDEIQKQNDFCRIKLVPLAVGGSPLSPWEKEGKYFNHVIDTCRKLNIIGKVSCVLWHQGESDSTLELSKTYKIRLTKMIEDYRMELQQPNLLFLIGELGEFLANNRERCPEYKSINTSIKQVIEKTPNTIFIPSTGLVDKGDKLHFSSESLKQFGIRYGKAYNEYYSSN